MNDVTSFHGYQYDGRNIRYGVIKIKGNTIRIDTDRQERTEDV